MGERQEVLGVRGLLIYQAVEGGGGDLVPSCETKGGAGVGSDV